MGKLKNNQSGFSGVEALLILVVLAIVGFTGWYVWHAKQNADKFLTSNNPSTAVLKNKTTTATSEPPSDLASYSDSNYSFRYPKTWAVYANHDQYNTVNVRSPDYKEDRAVPGQKGTYYLPSSGYNLAVSNIPSDAANNTLDQLTAHIVNEEKTLGGGSHKKITVGGYDALWVNNNYDDTYLYAIVFHDGTRTHIELNAKNDMDQSTVDQFNTILSSFTFK